MSPFERIDGKHLRQTLHARIGVIPARCGLTVNSGEKRKEEKKRRRGGFFIEVCASAVAVVYHMTQPCGCVIRRFGKL